MIRTLLLSLSLIVLFSCSYDEKELTEEQPPKPLQEAIQPSYTVETFKNEEETWGYRILKDGNLFINQPHIPAVQGNKGFSSSEYAQKTGEFIVNKLAAGIIPPTVSLEELDSLNVLN